MITEAREKSGLSKNQLAELANVSHTEIARIESGERELPNPKTLRKISKHIGVNYNDLMYAAGLGMQVTPLNPFLKRYYSSLKGIELDEALINTLGSIENWNALVKSLKERLNETNIEEEKELSRHTLEGRVVLIDCVTLWCTNYFFDLEADTDKALTAVKAEFDRLTQQDATFIFVTNEIGMGGTSENLIQRKFTDMQGWMNQYIASRANRVILMVSGIPVKVKDEK